MEKIFSANRMEAGAGSFTLFEAPGWRFGTASVRLDDGLEATTHRLYAEMLAAVGGLHLARIWNYVPAINAPGPGGLENYRLFCRGRAGAFEELHGETYKAFLPAASAVGCAGEHLTVVFAACAASPRHFENPLQTPAYEYPPEYGPRAPSFARASVVEEPRCVSTFISGTAAIRGHQTIAPHQTMEQLRCTVDNLRVIARSCGLEEEPFLAGTGRRHVKVYLRHAADYSLVADALRQQLLYPRDRVSFVEADVCRADLNVEIEITALLPR